MKKFYIRWFFLSEFLILSLIPCFSDPEVAQAAGLQEATSEKVNRSFQIPHPTGIFKIGVENLFWRDEARLELITEDPDDKRELLLQIWYPAERTQAATPATYYPFLDPLKDYLGNTNYEIFSNVRVNSFFESPILKSEKPFPVILFSHNRGLPPSYYTALLEDLASWGYVVVGINHTALAYVAYPDGRVARPYLPWRPNLELYADGQQTLDEFFAPQIEYLSGDILSVLDFLEILNRQDPKFKNRLDLQHVGILGHGFGSSLAIRACKIDQRLKACASLDGPASLADLKSGLHQPFLLFSCKPLSEGRHRVMDQTLMGMQSVRYRVHVPKLSHRGFTDLAGIGLEPQKIKLTHTRSIQISRAYIRAFFDQHLKKVPSDLLKEETFEFKEVKLSVLGR